MLNPPYLLFYPDANNDDVPDGDPVVHLEASAWKTRIRVTNSLRWGPDGWLYAAQGSTVTGHVLRPGIDKDAGLTPWASSSGGITPRRDAIEIFAEGGGNAFGVEIDAKGRIFSGHNGGNTRGFSLRAGRVSPKRLRQARAALQSLRLRLFPADGQPAVERFTHTFVIYDGGALPEHYDGKLFGVEPLQGHVVDERAHARQILLQNPGPHARRHQRRPWFRPVDIKVGPDGAIYIGDWYDRNVEHVLVQDGHIDTQRWAHLSTQGSGCEPAPPFDLGELSSLQLIDLLGHSNKWFRQTALRVMGDRKDKAIIPVLTELIVQTTGQRALEALWALHLSGGLTEATALKTLEHSDPFVRLWTARLLCDDNRVPSAIAEKLVRMAQIETDLEARAQLACSARRLPAKDDLAIVRHLLAHDEDAGDDRSRCFCGGQSNRKRKAIAPRWSHCSPTRASGAVPSCGNTSSGA